MTHVVARDERAALETGQLACFLTSNKIDPQLYYDQYCADGGP
jgi:hypothetical protein